MATGPRPYANPYVAGAGLGLVLLASYVLAGRGLGAVGAFSAVSRSFTTPGEPAPWTQWIFVELAGAIAGGFLSAVIAGRWRMAIDRGAGVSAPMRLLFASLGGVAMGAGAVIARGCTSGQALTGGALLSVGSWIFIAAAFGAGYLFAWPLRRMWR